jgi:hypothetical protein
MGGSEAMSDVSVLLDLNPPKMSEGEETITVPNLKGLTETEARDLLEDMGLILNSEGTGLVWSQNPQPGCKAVKGTAVKVQLRPPGLYNSHIQDAVPGLTYGNIIMD